MEGGAESGSPLEAGLEQELAAGVGEADEAQARAGALNAGDGSEELAALVTQLASRIVTSVCRSGRVTTQNGMSPRFACDAMRVVIATAAHAMSLLSTELGFQGSLEYHLFGLVRGAGDSGAPFSLSSPRLHCVGVVASDVLMLSEKNLDDDHVPGFAPEPSHTAAAGRSLPSAAHAQGRAGRGAGAAAGDVGGGPAHGAPDIAVTAVSQSRSTADDGSVVLDEHRAKSVVVDRRQLLRQVLVALLEEAASSAMSGPPPVVYPFQRVGSARVRPAGFPDEIQLDEEGRISTRHSGSASVWNKGIRAVFATLRSRASEVVAAASSRTAAREVLLEMGLLSPQPPLVPASAAAHGRAPPPGLGQELESVVQPFGLGRRGAAGASGTVGASVGSDDQRAEGDVEAVPATAAASAQAADGPGAAQRKAPSVLAGGRRAGSPMAPDARRPRRAEGADSAQKEKMKAMRARLQEGDTSGTTAWQLSLSALASLSLQVDDFFSILSDDRPLAEPVVSALVTALQPQAAERGVVLIDPQRIRRQSLRNVSRSIRPGAAAVILPLRSRASGEPVWSAVEITRERTRLFFPAAAQLSAAEIEQHLAGDPGIFVLDCERTVRSAHAAEPGASVASLAGRVVGQCLEEGPCTVNASGVEVCWHVMQLAGAARPAQPFSRQWWLAKFLLNSLRDGPPAHE